MKCPTSLVIGLFVANFNECDCLRTNNLQKRAIEYTLRVVLESVVFRKALWRFYARRSMFSDIGGIYHKTRFIVCS
jgi:hypothetical protein